MTKLRTTLEKLPFPLRFLAFLLLMIPVSLIAVAIESGGSFSNFSINFEYLIVLYSTFVGIYIVVRLFGWLATKVYTARLAQDPQIKKEALRQFTEGS
jgi:hypothetical protein